VDKPHYYDGKTYEILFDGALKELRAIVDKQIEAAARW